MTARDQATAAAQRAAAAQLDADDAALSGAQRVAAASERVRAARAAEADAAHQVVAADSELSRIRAAEPGNIDAITAAEQRLDAAIARHTTATTQAADADNRLAAARRAVSTETDRHAGVLDRLRAAFQQSTAAGENHRGLLDRLRTAIQGASTDTNNASGIMRLFGQAARDNDGPISGLLQKLSLLGTAAQGLKLFLTPTLFAELIPPALGLAGAVVQASGALAILPGVLATLLTSFGAIKIATKGFGDALKAAFKNPDDINAVNEALKNLSPSAQQAARAILALKKPFDDFRKSIQEEFFKGLGPEITATANSLMNTFRPAFLSIAQTANQTLKGIAQDLRGVKESADLRSIGLSSSTVFKDLAAAVRPLLQAFLDVAEVGARVFAELTGGAAGATQKFADFIARIKASGELEQIIRKGLDALKEMGQIAINVGSALGSIFKAANADGKSFLDTLRDGSKAFAEFAKSAQGQEMFKALFAVLHDLQSAMTEILHAAPALTPVLTALHQGLQALFEPLPQVVDGLAGIATALAPLLPLAGQVGGALASGLATVLKDLTPIVADIVTGIQGFVTNALPGLKVGFQEAWTVAKPLLEVLGQIAKDVLPPLGTALGAIATALGPIAPLVLGVVAAYKTWQAITKAVETAQKSLQVAMAALDWLGFTNKATTAFTTVETQAKTRAAGTEKAWKGAISGIGLALGAFVAGEALKAFGKPLDPGKNLSTASWKEKLQDMADTAGDVLTLNIPGLFEKLKRDWDALPSDLQGAADRIKGIFGQVPEALKPLPDTVNGVLGGLVPVINTGVSNIAAAVGQLSPLTMASLSPLPPTMRDAANAAVGGMVPIIELGMQNITNQVMGLTPQVQAALAPLPPQMQQSVNEAMGGLLPVVNTGIANITAAVGLLPPQAGAALAGLPPAMQGPANAAMGGMIPVIQAGIANITATITGLPPAATGALAGLPAAMQGPANSAMGGMLPIIQTGINNIAQTVGTLPGTAQSNLGGLPGAVQGPAQQAAASGNQAMAAGVNQIAATAGTLPGRTQGAVGNMSGTLSPAGTSAMSGFYNAMISFYNNTIAPWLASLAAKIASLKGPVDHDRQILIPAGLAIMAGLNEGLTTGLGPVLDTVSGTAGQIVDQLRDRMPELRAWIERILAQFGRIPGGGHGGGGSGGGGNPVPVVPERINFARAATTRAVGSARVDFEWERIVAAFGAAINDARLTARGTDLTLIVNRANRQLARRA